MSNCYKNFPVIVDYSDSTTDTIYSNSATLSENLNIQHAKSLGIKGSNAVFIKTLTQGELSVESYLINDLGIINKMKGVNDQGIQLQFGPYQCPAPCVLTLTHFNLSPFFSLSLSLSLSPLSLSLSLSLALALSLSLSLSPFLSLFLELLAPPVKGKITASQRSYTLWASKYQNQLLTYYNHKMNIYMYMYILYMLVLMYVHVI